MLNMAIREYPTGGDAVFEGRSGCAMWDWLNYPIVGLHSQISPGNYRMRFRMRTNFLQLEC